MKILYASYRPASEYRGDEPELYAPLSERRSSKFLLNRLIDKVSRLFNRAISALYLRNYLLNKTKRQVSILFNKTQITTHFIVIKRFEKIVLVAHTDKDNKDIATFITEIGKELDYYFSQETFSIKEKFSFAKFDQLEKGKFGFETHIYKKNRMPCSESTSTQLIKQGVVSHSSVKRALFGTKANTDKLASALYNVITAPSQLNEEAL